MTCPRSNQWVGVGVPPIERFYRSGVAVAVGTDSLASVEDLNLFSRAEDDALAGAGGAGARAARERDAAGARALGLGDELGIDRRRASARS